MPFHVAAPLMRIEQAREDNGLNVKVDSRGVAIVKAYVSEGIYVLPVFPPERTYIYVRGSRYEWTGNANAGKP
jgi:hypothetical protein